MQMVLDDKGALQALVTAPDRIRKEFEGNLRQLGLRFQRYITKELLTGQVLDRRTGMGQRSIFYRLETDQQETQISLTVGADLAVAPYMRAQALGATIRPKRGRYLAIPMDAAKTASGVARFSARDLMGNPQQFGYSSAFARNGVIFGVRYQRRTIEGQRVLTEGTDAWQSGRGLTPLFALKTQVQLGQRNYLAIARHALDSEITAAGARVADVGVQHLTGAGASTPTAGGAE